MTKMGSQIYYTTTGSVRGECGHKHRSVETAESCSERDSRGCKSQGGYSDRRIIAIEDGEERELSEDELVELEEATPFWLR